MILTKDAQQKLLGIFIHWDAHAANVAPWLRQVAIWATAVYLFLSTDRHDVDLVVPLLILFAAALFNAAALSPLPLHLPAWVRGGTAAVISDSVFITSLLVATGGVNSPLYVLLSFSIADIALRFSRGYALAITLAYSASLLWIIALSNVRNPAAGDYSVLIRIWFTALIVGTLAEAGRKLAAQYEQATRLNEENSELRSVAQASATRFLNLVQRMDAIVWEADANLSRFTFVSQRLSTMLGYAESTWLTEQDFFFNHVVHPDDRNRVREQNNRAVAAKQDYEVEFRASAISGDVHWLSNVVRVVAGSPGRPPRLTGMLVDMTERKALEDELREQEAQYRTLVEESNDGVALLYQGERVLVNQAFADLHGYATPEEIRRVPVETWVHPDDLPKLQEMIGEFRRGEGLGRAFYEYRVLRPDGTVRVVEASNARVPYKGDYAILVFLRDMTERKQLEDALRESEEHYRAVVEQSSEAIRIVSDGVVVYVNPAFLRIHGVSDAAEVVGRPEWDFMLDEDRAPVEAWFQQPRSQGQTAIRYTYRMRRPDGQIRVIEASASSITHNGRRAVLSSLQDVTERQALQAALEEREEQYRVLLENCSDGIAHNVRGIRVYVNPAYATLHGLSSAEEALGGPIDFYAVDEDKPLIRELVRLSNAGMPLPETVVYRIRRPDGEVRTIELASKAITYRGEPGIIAILRDITDSRRLQEALQEREDQYRALVENSTDAISLTVDGRRIYVNQAYLYLYQLSTVEEALSLPSGYFVIEEDKPAFLANLQTTLAGMIRTASYIFRVRRRDGQVRTIEVVNRIIPYKGQVAIMAVLRDTTERKRLESELVATNERLHTLINAAPQAIVNLDQDQKIILWNAAAERIFGWTAEEVIGKPIPYIPPASVAEAEQVTQQVYAGGVVQALETQRMRKDGTLIDVLVSIAPVRDSTGELVGSFGIITDITESKRLERELQEREQQYRALVESPAAAISIAVDGVRVFVNQAFVDLHGLSSSAEAVGKPVAHLSITGDQMGQQQRAIDHQASQGEVLRTSYAIRRPDGEQRILEAYITRINYRGQAALQAVFRDITARQKLEDELKHLAHHDMVTGQLNRLGFTEALDYTLAPAMEEKPSGAVLFLDLDNFKDINDELGHAAGDRFLAGLAAHLKDQLSEQNVLARLGGDEFGILLPECTPAEASETAARLLEAVRQYTADIDGSRVGVTASLGIAHFPAQGAAASDLLSHADLAMYQAKERGRDTFAVYAPRSSRQRIAQNRISWETRIRDALQDSRFVLFAQPILDLATNTVPQYELLLRLQEADSNDLVSPTAFLRVAERFGLIQAIDRWVMQHAVISIAECRDRGQDVKLEVNLSGRVFRDETFLPLLKREIAAYEIDPSKLIFEITETATISDVNQARRVLEKIRDLGCRIALDDFGVGFASFHHLKHLPLDYLKIDGHFIKDLATNPIDQRLVPNIVRTAQAMSIKTIAEFVSNHETLEILRSYGVDYAQGFYVGKPRLLEEVMSQNVHV